jgi:hypothetical protein
MRQPHLSSRARDRFAAIVCASTKNAVCVISEGLRQEASGQVRHFAGLHPNGLAES